MNDVLPKPFTKEGLMICLDKHLGHLKKDAQIIQSSTGVSLKGDESPGQSPATMSASWNSPATMQGPSPIATHMSHDPYANAVRHAPQYGQLDGPGYGHHGSAPHTPLSAGPHTSQRFGPPQPHRRHPSDMSGPEDPQGQAKRHQMYPPQQSQGYQHR